MEKGQYICKTCNSPLAEYREFKKPDEIADAGNAVPITEQIENPLPETQIPEPEIPPTIETPIQQPEVSLSNFENVSALTPSPEPQAPQGVSQDNSDSSFNAIAGLAVYDENAKKVGIVKQVGVDSNHSVILVLTANDGTTKNINWNEIKKIGEIILLGSPSSPAPQQSYNEPAINQLICPNCNIENKPGSKFCEGCGSKLN